MSLNDNGPTQAGVNDYNDTTGQTVIEVQTADGIPVSPTKGTPLKQQVVQLSSEAAAGQMIKLLTEISARLKHLEEEQCGYSI